MTDSPTDPTGARTGERIAKLLARAGVASRREVERLIAEGRVRLNDEVVTTPATVLPDLRGITVDGRPVRAPEATRLFLFHKPSGLITAERDPNGKPTIYAALRNALPQGTPRVMPVGRLDLNTEGLLLLTNDGELKRALELPASGVPRTYRARTFGDITQSRLEDLIEGVQIGDIRYGAIDANMERRTGRNQWIELTLAEGKNREVRRVLEFLGLEVSRLLRTAYGPFHLGDLPRGSAWEVPQAVVERFRKALLGGGKALAPVFAPPMEAPAPRQPAQGKTEPERAAPQGGRGGGPRGGPRSAKPGGERPARPAPPRGGERGVERGGDRGSERGGDRRAPAPGSRRASPAAHGDGAAPLAAPTGRRARGEPGQRPARSASGSRETLYSSRSEAAGKPDRNRRSDGPRKPGGGGRPGGGSGGGGKPGGKPPRPGGKSQGRRP
ncbi:pseudouridine synthase [Novosphingobium bradum]|uniref:Pseudouridine synthase n=1 Tax=Novosphingobium bradum TaxID=1737444 RepID=A0ABV7IN75_9SPHN